MIHSGAGFGSRFFEVSAAKNGTNFAEGEFTKTGWAHAVVNCSGSSCRSFSSFIITGLLDFRIPQDVDAVSVIAFRGTL